MLVNGSVVSFFSCHSTYLSAQYNSTVALTNFPGDQEKWIVEVHGKKQTNLRTQKKKYNKKKNNFFNKSEKKKKKFNT